MGAGVLAGASLLPRAAAQHSASAPSVVTNRSAKPVVIASANANVSKDRDGLTCVAKAFKTLTDGADKIPGRGGDSPILGAGLYVDGDIGAAGSTGRGEANLFSLRL